MHIFGEIPFFRPQNDTKTTVKRLKTMKNDMRDEVTYLFVVVVFSACRKNVGMIMTCNRYDAMNIM